MEYNKMILFGESVGILATVLISIKIMFLQPTCFSLFDGYTTVLPVVFSKIVETIAIFGDRK